RRRAPPRGAAGAARPARGPLGCRATPPGPPRGGALRWQPPRPAAPWHGTRAATSYGPHCPQPAGSFGRASTSEDCLYLNVFTPAGTKPHKLPVMGWVHGGSLRTGESDGYKPADLL